MSSAVVWEAFHNENGQRYYYNPSTNESSWTLPPGAIFIDKEKEAGKDITANPIFTNTNTLNAYSAPKQQATTVAPVTNFNVQTVNTTRSNANATTTNNKSGVWNNKRNLIIFGGIVALVIIAVVVAVALVFTGKKSSDSYQPGSAALDEYTAANYESKSKQLSLNSAAMMNSDASAILSTIFPSLGGAVNFTNSLPVLSGSGSIDISSLISIGQSFGIDVTPITNLLKNAIASKIFTGTLNRADKLERPNGVFTADTNCVIALFYKLNEVKFTPETIQFAVQCQLNAEWKPETNLPKFYSFGSFDSSGAPVTAPSWLSEWNIIGNASIVISSLDYEYIEKVAESNAAVAADISRLPRFLSKGINVFATATARDTKSSLFNGLDGILTKPLAATPYVNLQFSLPLDITFAVDEATGKLNPAVKFGFISSDRPVKGLIEAKDISLNFKENTGLVGSSLNFYIEGYSSAIAEVQFETNITLVMYGGSKVNTWLVGGWSRDSGLIILNGAFTGKWVPFAASDRVGKDDPRQVSIVSDAKLQVNLSYAPNQPLSLNLVRFYGSASFSYIQTDSGLFPDSLPVEGVFTKENIVFALPHIPVRNIASLITTMIDDANPTPAARENVTSAMTFLSRNIPQLLQQGSLTLTISTFNEPYRAEGINAFIKPGVTFQINEVVINTKAFDGILHTFIKEVDPRFDALFDVRLNLPLRFHPSTGLQSTNNPISFTFIVGNLRIEDFVINNFFIDMDVSLVDPSKFFINSEATITLNLPVLSSTPLTFIAGVGFTQTPVKKLDFYGNVVGGAIQPKFAPWLKLSAPALSLTVFPDGNNNAKNAKYKRYSLQISADVQFLFVPGTKPIACKLSVIDDIFVFSAKDVSMANIYPALANYVGVPLTQQSIDILLTNANGTNPLTITKLNNALGLPGSTFDASTISSLSPLVANLPETFPLAQPGLNLFAHNLPLANGNNALSLLGSSLSNINLNFSAYFPFSIHDQWSVSLETSAPISVTKIFTLNHAYFSFDILPSPLRISTAIGALMTMNIPFNPPLTLDVDGAYSTVNNNLTFSGVLSKWDKPFGLPFLTIGETRVKFASYKKNGTATTTGSLSTSASFRSGPSVGLCGALIGGDVALSVSNLGVQSITDTVCQVLGICNGLPNDILNLLGLNNLQFGINLASDNIIPSSVSNTDIYCSIPANVRKGVSVTTNIDLKGTFIAKLKEIIPDFEKFAAGLAWQFVINLPFLAPSTQSLSLHPIRSSYDQKIRLQALNPSHSALQILSKKELSDRAKFLQGLAGASAVVFAYENKQINLKITNWFTLDGIGIQADATAINFALWTQATVQLKGNDDPLVFFVSGAFNGAQVTLTGQLSIANGGWVNPFGLKGLTVYNVGMSVSLGPPAGISGFGLNFKLRFGPKIVVAFAGSISTASIDSYLSGSIYSDGPESAVSPITLGDLFLVVEQMTGKKLNLPPLPGADILSLTKASFSLATASGKDPNGNDYAAGFRFTCIATLFGIDISTDVGTVQRSVNGIPMVDFVLSLILQFAKFNQKIIEWVDKIIPFNVNDWLKNGKSLCDIACVKKIAITGFSVVDIITAQRFPELELTVAFFGNEKSFKVTLDFDKMKSAFAVILDGIKSAFNWNFCVIDANCKGGQVCSHDTWKCTAECPEKQVKVPGLGCFPKLSIPGLFNADVNYVAPDDWYKQVGVDPYGDPEVYQQAWIAWVQAHAGQDATTRAP